MPLVHVKKPAVLLVPDQSIDDNRRRRSDQQNPAIDFGIVMSRRRPTQVIAVIVADHDVVGIARKRSADFPVRGPAAVAIALVVRAVLSPVTVIIPAAAITLLRLARRATWRIGKGCACAHAGDQ